MNSKITLFSLLISVFITFCVAGLSESYTKENICQKRIRAQFEDSIKKCTSGACRVSATKSWQSLYDRCPKGDLYTLCRIQRGAYNVCENHARQLEEITKERCEEESKKTYKPGNGLVFPPSEAYCLLGPKRNCYAAFCS